MRFLFAFVVTLTFAGEAHAAEPSLTRNDLDEDFAFVCREVAATYAYFDLKATSWDEVCRLYRGDLQRVTNREGFVELLEHMVDELYDPHAQLTTNRAASPRLVPSGTDLWAEWQGDRAVITQVREGSDAERAGIAPNAIVVALNDQKIDAAIDARMGRSYSHSNPAARDWALRAVLAGVHNTARRLTLRVGNTEKVITLVARDQFAHRSDAPVSHSEIRPGVGYIQLNDSLGNDATVAAFDQALKELASTRALIVDLRNTASGGNSSVARGILGRFVARELPYQKHVLPAEEHETGVRRSWLELVSPRGDFRYGKPTAVLVNRWTGSMGEGLAIGFDATIVGTPMARLIGATYTLSLPHAGFGVNVPAERLYHVGGTPREQYVPKVLVDVATISRLNDKSDPFIAAALRVLAVQN